MIKTRRVKYADKFLEMDHGIVIVRTPLAEISVNLGGETVDGEPLLTVEILKLDAAAVDPPYDQDQHRSVIRIRGKAR